MSQNNWADTKQTTLQENTQKAYALIHDQCTLVLQTELKGQDNFANVEGNQVTSHGQTNGANQRYLLQIQCIIQPSFNFGTSKEMSLYYSSGKQAVH